MATDTRNKTEGQESSDVAVQRSSQNRRDARRWEGDRYASGPFGLMRQMQDEVDRWFDRAGLGRGWTHPSAWVPDSNWMPGSNWMARAAEQIGDWTPAIEAFQRGNEFVVRAEVPGMSRNDLTVEIGDDAVTIRGERKQEQTDEREGMYWTERSYGSFSRTIPLPPGAIAESAKANFHNGVLEIVMQAPSQESRRGRKLDITAHEKETGPKKV